MSTLYRYLKSVEQARGKDLKLHTIAQKLADAIPENWISKDKQDEWDEIESREGKIRFIKRNIVDFANKYFKNDKRFITNNVDEIIRRLRILR